MNTYTDLADLAEDIASHVCGCLDGTSLGTPSECTVYWSNPPDDLDCGDCRTNGALIVWIDQLFPAKDWPSPWNGPLKRETTTTTAVLNLRLIRPCWPSVGDTDIPTPLPSRATTAAKAADITEDAAAVLCCLVAAARDGDGIFGSCRRVSLGVLRPDSNRGRCAGFTVPITVDLGACCTTI